MSESPTKEGMSPKAGADYEEVAFGFDGANVFAPSSTKFGPRFQMAVSLSGGIILMLLHHFFCAYLNGKAVDSQRFAFHGFSLSNQSVSSIISNAIAYVTHTVLSAGIGIAFIQVFWLKLRREQLSVRQVDAALACKGEPFTPSALPTWRYAFWLAIIAAMATLMAFISIIAPGALRINSSEFTSSTPCTVRTVSLQTSNIGSFVSNSTDGSTELWGAQAGLMGLTYQVLMSGVTLQARNPCVGACEYEIDFNAPLASCSPVDSSFNYTDWLPPPDNDTTPVTLWSAHLGKSNSSGVTFIAATRDLSTNDQSAVNCSVYNATHHAIVTHTNTSSSSIRVYQSNMHEKLKLSNFSSADGVDYTGMQYGAIIVAFVDALSGTVNYHPDSEEFDNSQSLFVAYCPSFAGSMGKPWASIPDLMTVLPSLLQNMTLSLLSDQLSQGGNSTTSDFASTCFFTSSAYRYVKVRLLTTYGAALVIAAVCIVFGYRAVRLNGCEESVLFSRMLGAILNKPLFDDRYALSRSSKLTAEGSADGQLRLLPTTDG